MQPHASAARHLRHLLEREDHHFAVFADRGDKLTLHVCDRPSRIGRRDIEHLFALTGVGEALVLGHDEAAPLRAGEKKLAPSLVAKDRHKLGFLLQINEQPDRLAVAAAAGKLCRIEGVEAAVAGEHQAFRRGLRRECEFRPIIRLERDARQIGDRPA